MINPTAQSGPQISANTDPKSACQRVFFVVAATGVFCGCTPRGCIFWLQMQPQKTPGCFLWLQKPVFFVVAKLQPQNTPFATTKYTQPSAEVQ